MQEINVVLSINSKIIDSEYAILSETNYLKSGKELPFTLEEYSEYIQIITNSVIKKSGGKATTPFRLGDTPISNTLSIALTSVGKHVDQLRNMIFIPVSNVKDFSISVDKFDSISIYVLKASKELAVVSRVPGPRSADLRDVMTSRVMDRTIYSINDAIAPTAISNCALVLPSPDKNVAFAEQMNVLVEEQNYASKLVKG